MVIFGFKLYVVEVKVIQYMYIKYIMEEMNNINQFFGSDLSIFDWF